MRYFLISLFCLFSIGVLSQKNPNIPFYKPRPGKFIPVNDFAGMLTQDERSLLAKNLLQYRDTSGNVLVIITQKNLKDPNTGDKYQLEEAAKHYFNNWGIGAKEKNNGVLVFVVKDDRKIRIATGAGIENILTNDACQLIINEKIIPNFKNNNYYLGLNEAVEEVKRQLSPGLYNTENNNATISNFPEQNYSYNSGAGNNNSTSPFPVIAFIVLVLVIILWLVKVTGSNSGNSAVYNSSGINAGFSPRRRGWSYFFSGWFLSNLFSNRDNYNNNSSNNYSGYNDNSSFDSGYSSSSSDSFSSSSGGDSSFGGGSSDGGGASGSW